MNTLSPDDPFVCTHCTDTKGQSRTDERETNLALNVIVVGLLGTQARGRWVVGYDGNTRRPEVSYVEPGRTCVSGGNIASRSLKVNTSEISSVFLFSILHESSADCPFGQIGNDGQSLEAGIGRQHAGLKSSVRGQPNRLHSFQLSDRPYCHGGATRWRNWPANKGISRGGGCEHLLQELRRQLSGHSVCDMERARKS